MKPRITRAPEVDDRPRPDRRRLRLLRPYDGPRGLGPPVNRPGSGTPATEPIAHASVSPRPIRAGWRAGGRETDHPGGVAGRPHVVGAVSDGLIVTRPPDQPDGPTDRSNPTPIRRATSRMPPGTAPHGPGTRPRTHHRRPSVRCPGGRRGARDHPPGRRSGPLAGTSRHPHILAGQRLFVRHPEAVGTAVRGPSPCGGTDVRGSGLRVLRAGDQSHRKRWPRRCQFGGS